MPESRHEKLKNYNMNINKLWRDYNRLKFNLGGVGSLS